MTDYIGQKFGNYTLFRLLGQGGFANVYLGEHIYLKTHAAIKVLQMRLANDNMKDFLQEARTIASLMHPNIIRVLDFGIEGGIPFLVMDYAPNGSLRQRYSRGKAHPIASILPHIKEVAAALHYAHERKMIHRDVKPENLLVGRNHEVLLSDFGIAVIAQSTRDQRPGEVAGTMPYMAPEQIRGRPSPKSDQYALGIITYEWLSGTLPFQGTYIELMSQHIHAAPPSLFKKVPDLPVDVEEVVMIALRKEPERRFADIAAFITALEQASQSTRPLSPPSFSPGILPLRLRSTPVLDPLPGRYNTELALSLQQVNIGPQQLPDLPVTERATSAGAHIQEITTRHTPRLSLSRRGVVSGLIGLGVVALGCSTGIVWFAAHKNTSNTSATPAYIGNLLYTYKGHQDKVVAVAWSPDGKRIASGSWDQTAQVWDALTGDKVVTYRGHTKAINSLAWSPDGKAIVTSSLDGTAQVWDAKTLQTRVHYSGHAQSVAQYGVSAVAWSPSPKMPLIASVGDDKTVQIWTADTGRRIATYLAHVAIVRCVAWSPDGRYIASGGFDKQVRVWEAATGTTITSHKHTAHVCSVAWSPDGQYIVSASDDRKVQVWQWNTPAQPLFIFDDTSVYQGVNSLGIQQPTPANEDDFYAPGTNVFAVAWSPDGKHIATVDKGGYMFTWDALTNGTNPVPHNGDFHFINAVAWAPDSKHIATGNDSFQVQIWQER